MEELRALFAQNLAFLVGLGWMPGDDITSEVAVFRKFKNGKPRATPALNLSFSPFNVTLIFDGDTLTEQTAPAHKPWKLSGELVAGNTRSFVSLHAAFSQFLELAAAHAPTP